MASTIKVDVVSAEEKIFSGDAELVSLPGQSGDLGILPGHTPLITLIRPGMVRIHMPGKAEALKVFVAGGVLEVQPDRVTVLADTAVRSEDLDEAKAKQALEEARNKRQNATGQLEIAKLEAQIAAMTAELALVKKIRSQN
ncbi:MAG: ATP synthase epsilon chain [Burkholderia sp.]|jgi:F-type H+-transporting ATPase subunit epsilon